MQQGGMISKEARKTPFSLIVTFPAGVPDGEAKGNLFIDDDELPEMKLGNGYSTYIDFYATINKGTVKVWSEVQEGKFALAQGLYIETVTVLGLDGSGQASALEVDGKPVTGASNIELSTTKQNVLEEQEDGGNKVKTLMVEIKGLSFAVGKNFAITWNMGIKS
nr:alpha-xylosidase 1 [Quercus suber]